MSEDELNSAFSAISECLVQQ